jgi:hypothetical protein
MDSSEALSFVAWAMVIALLVRRTMFGPQKGYARLALALIWLGEVMVVLSAVAPALRAAGGVIERAGFVVMFTMLIVQFRWELRRRGPSV